MSYCVTPGCLTAQNPNTAQFCLSCGSVILLKSRYRPLQPIGQGGFGRTFLGVDEDIPSKPRCVIKQLHLETKNSLILAKAVELFHQEAVRLEDLGQHPQIPELLAHFEQQRRLYLVQELIEGQTLEQELQQQGVLKEDEIWELLRDLLPVLKFIHDRQVIHRDIKPANIIRRRADRKLVLIDFGVAKLLSNTAMLHTGTAVGSAEYMAPEQTRGKALPTSDLYSLGVTCIYLLTGVSPFDLFDINQNKWAWQQFLPSGTQVSDRLRKILDKLLQPALSQRYQSVGEVLQAVTATPFVTPSIERSPPHKPTHFLANLWQQYTHHSSGSGLISAVGVNYTQLQYFLAIEKWQLADQETWNVLCQVVGKPLGGYLQAGDFYKFPCEDLMIIDQLWTKYSQGHFGLSVQTQIYEEVEREYNRFCDRVGWPTHNPAIPESSLNFGLRAPRGHLPSRRAIGGYAWWHHVEYMAARFQQCSS
jgi:serine/threonine protein kinase